MLKATVNLMPPPYLRYKGVPAYEQATKRKWEFLKKWFREETKGQLIRRGRYKQYYLAFEIVTKNNKTVSPEKLVSVFTTLFLDALQKFRVIRSTRQCDCIGSLGWRIYKGNVKGNKINCYIIDESEVTAWLKRNLYFSDLQTYQKKTKK